MSTVGKPVGKSIVTPKLVSDSLSSNYGRPASGGAPVAGKQEGNAPANPPAGVIPDSSITTLPNNGGTAGDSGTGLGQ